MTKLLVVPVFSKINDLIRAELSVKTFTRGWISQSVTSLDTCNLAYHKLRDGFKSQRDISGE